MKLLISAYACAPNRGSEHALGWDWITEAARLGHHVRALVSPAHRNAIESACRENPLLKSIDWIFPTVRFWAPQAGVEPRWERTYNFLWQISARKEAKKLQRAIQFDIIHHLTWAGIRAPTYLGNLGSPLIIGPIGGGETSPKSLRKSFGPRGRFLEFARDISNATIRINPMVRGGLHDAAMIFASTDDTKKALGKRLVEKVVVFSQFILTRPACARALRDDGTLKLLYAGRLIYWKGVHLAISALAKAVAENRAIRLTIVGDGRERKRLEQQAKALNVLQHINFIPRLPQNDFFALYETHDVLLFPSLHDSAGFVVLEALSHGLPVICLDLGGPALIVTPECGICVETSDLNPEEVCNSLGAAILRFAANRDVFAKLSCGATARAIQFSVAERVASLYDRAFNRIARQQGYPPVSDGPP